jgi:hypothetical protein
VLVGERCRSTRLVPDWQTEASTRFADVAMEVALPQTWLLREGWRRARIALAVGHPSA